ncbi:MAG: hypothetical protein AAF664_25670 [Planctomycetota bacterium]
MNEPTNSMPDINRKVTIAFAAALVIAVLATIALLMPVPSRGRMFPAIGDMVHAPMFAGLTIGMFFGLQILLPTSSIKTIRTRAVVVGFLVLVFGVASEIVQDFFGRSGNLHDAVSDALGISGALCVIVAWTLHRPTVAARSTWASKPFCWALVVTGILMIGLSWISPVATIHDTLASRREFPLLASFERQAELERWHFRDCSGSLSTQDATLGAQSLEIKFPASQAGNATLFEIKRDWSNAQSLMLEVAVDEKRSCDVNAFVLQIVDQSHGREYRDVFRKEVLIKRGEKQTITIPRQQWISRKSDRPLQLEWIRAINLIITEPSEETVVRVDDIRLSLGEQSKG